MLARTEIGKHPLHQEAVSLFWYDRHGEGERSQMAGGMQNGESDGTGPGAALDYCQTVHTAWRLLNCAVASRLGRHGCGL